MCFDDFHTFVQSHQSLVQFLFSLIRLLIVLLAGVINILKVLVFVFLALGFLEEVEHDLIKYFWFIF